MFLKNSASDLWDLHKDTARWGRDKDKVHLSQERQTQRKVRHQPVGLLLLTPWLWEPAAIYSTNLQLDVSNEEQPISWCDSHRMQKYIYSFSVSLGRMWVFMCLRVYVDVYLYVCICRWRKSMSDVFFSFIPVRYLYRLCDWTWSSLTWLDWLGSEWHGSTCLCRNPSVG